MYMYNQNGDKALVSTDQIPALEAAGWSKTAPVVEEVPVDTSVGESAGSETAEKPKKLTLKK